MQLESYEKIRSAIAEIAEIDAREINGESHFINDLDMDSMLALELLATLERAFHIQIPETEIDKFVNLNEVHSLVSRLIKEKPENHN